MDKDLKRNLGLSYYERISEHQKALDLRLELERARRLSSENLKGKNAKSKQPTKDSSRQ